MVDLWGRHRQLGNWEGAAHLSNDNTGALRFESRNLMWTTRGKTCWSLTSSTVANCETKRVYRGGEERRKRGKEGKCRLKRRAERERHKGERGRGARGDTKEEK